MKNITKKALIFSAMLSFAILLSACQPAQPLPTVSPTSGIQGKIFPPTIQAYVDEVHLDQTTRIEFTHPVSQEQVVITAQSMIRAIVELLDSKVDHCVGIQESTDYALLIIMNVPAEGGENIVSVDYRPTTSDVLLDNIPTGSWPVKIQGSYTVCPDFGKSLFGLLGINVSSVEPTTGATPTVQVTPSGTSVPSIIEYQNTEYGFSFSLPVIWKGYSIITDTWQGYNNGNSGITVEQGPIISIRHPLWTSENPYQDIPIMVFTLAQWNSLQQGDYSVSAGGIYTELGRNAKYVFALYSRYNFVTLPGMEEVKTILEGNPLHIP